MLDGIVLGSCNSFGQLLGRLALLQTQNTKTKGLRPATQMHAYAQYPFMRPIIATVDFDAKDEDLVQEGHPKRSKWLMQNAVVVRLGEGEAFYMPQGEVVGPPADTLFARHLNARRQPEAEP